MPILSLLFYFLYLYLRKEVVEVVKSIQVKGLRSPTCYYHLLKSPTSQVVKVVRVRGVGLCGVIPSPWVDGMGGGCYNHPMHNLPLTTDPELPLLLKPAPIFKGWDKRPLVGREKQLYLRNRFRVASVLWGHYAPELTKLAIEYYVKHGPRSQRIFR